MSDRSQGAGWWQASDGKWYPPEQDPRNRPAAPPPPPSYEPPPFYEPAPAGRRRERSGTSIWKVALGVCLGLFLFIIACVAIIGGAADKVEDDANKPATLSIEAPADVCWLLTLTGTGEGIAQSQQEGCGPTQVAMPGGLGANASVTKRSGEGDLTAVVRVDGEETTRETTNAEFGTVTVSR